MEHAYAIEAVGLRKTYPGSVVALDDVSFTVEAGAIFGLLGPNGAGKSTTVRILTTLARPDRGQARILGIDVRDDPGHVRRTIGVVAQKAGVDPEDTGRENLRLAGQLYGMRGPALESEVSALLERFELADAADRVAGTYSGGMQRKLAVAMGLVHRPEVLFLDEPTSGLDPVARTEVWREIERLTAEGLTILLTTHYLEDANRLAGRVAIVDRGRIVAVGTPDELKSELQGDTIHVELSERVDGAATSALDTVPGVHTIEIDGRALRARADHGPDGLRDVLAALEGAGVRVVAARVAQPSLDDVYLRYAGREFSAVGRTEAVKA